VQFEGVCRRRTGPLFGRGTELIGSVESRFRSETIRFSAPRLVGDSGVENGDTAPVCHRSCTLDRRIRYGVAIRKRNLSSGNVARRVTDTSRCRCRLRERFRRPDVRLRWRGRAGRDQNDGGRRLGSGGLAERHTSTPHRTRREGCWHVDTMTTTKPWPGSRCTVAWGKNRDATRIDPCIVAESFATLFGARAATGSGWSRLVAHPEPRARA